MIVLFPLILINDNVVIGIVSISYEQSPCPSAPVFNPTNEGTYTIRYNITDPAPPKYVSAYIVNFDKEQKRKTFYEDLCISNSDEQTITWDGKSDSGSIVANGQYYFKIESSGTPGGAVLSTKYARVSVNGGSGGFVYNPFYWCNFHSVPGYYFDNDPVDETPRFKDYRNGSCSYNEHKGTDYTCSTGIYLYAGFTGTVKKIIETVPNNDHTIREGWPWGNYIKIQRSEDTSWQILYAHLAFNSVISNLGDTVNAGQKVAQADNTRNSKGSHLHFELIQNGTPKDPYLYGCYFIQDPRGCSYCESGCHSSSVCP